MGRRGGRSRLERTGNKPLKEDCRKISVFYRLVVSWECRHSLCTAPNELGPGYVIVYFRWYLLAACLATVWASSYTSLSNKPSMSSLLCSAILCVKSLKFYYSVEFFKFSFVQKYIQISNNKWECFCFVRANQRKTSFTYLKISR